MSLLLVDWHDEELLLEKVELRSPFSDTLITAHTASKIKTPETSHKVCLLLCVKFLEEKGVKHMDIFSKRRVFLS